MKRRSMFSAIESRAESLKTIREGGTAFIVIALIQFVAAYFLFPTMYIDASLYLILAILLLVFKGRIVSILLLVVTLGGMVVTFMNRLSDSAAGGTNIILALILVWTAGKIIEATFKLRGRFKDEPTAQPQQYSEMVYLNPAAPPVEKKEAGSIVDTILIFAVAVLMFAVAGALYFYFLL